MKYKTIKELSCLLQTKSVSALELARYFLGEIKQRDVYNAVITVDEEKTLAQAKAADAARARGEVTDLTGIPIIYKDLFCHAGWRVTCGSKMLENFISPYTATVVERLDAAGTVALGRANMDEFAMGSTTETSYYQPTLNPWDLRRVPGGSSGGSAAAVAAGLTPAALGSDTGGSIRQPAAHCGITGIKPTYGLVSRFGMVAYASSFDQAGPMAATAEDCALLLRHMIAFDPKDSTSIKSKETDFTLHSGQSIKGMKIGLPREFFRAGLAGEVADSLQAAVAVLTAMGAEIRDITLPRLDYSIPVYYVLASAEASSNLARFDGVRYGYRTQSFNDLEEFYSKTRAEGFGAEVKRRIMIGTYVLSHGYYDAYYVKAQKIRRLLADDLHTAFAACDFILAPTAPTAAPLLNAGTPDPVKMYLSDIFTLFVNLAGLPAMSLPGPQTAAGLPVGLQLIGNYFTESKLLNAAYQLQQHTDWHRRRAPLAGYKVQGERG